MEYEKTLIHIMFQNYLCKFINLQNTNRFITVLATLSYSLLKSTVRQNESSPDPEKIRGKIKLIR